MADPRTRRLAGAAAAALLAGCEGRAATGFDGLPDAGCPEGTAASGGECVADRPEVGACDPACGEGETCRRGCCFSDALPDLTGHWRGEWRVLMDCGTQVCLFGPSQELTWDVVQCGTTLAIDRPDGETSEGTVSQDGVRITYASEMGQLVLAFELAGIVSYYGNVIRGEVTGEFTDTAYVPSRDCADYQAPCPLLPGSRFLLERQTGPAPRGDPPALDGPWEGPWALGASCTGTPYGLRGTRESRINFETRQDGLLSGNLDVRGRLSGPPWAAGEVHGHLDGDVLALEGLLEGDDEVYLRVPPQGDPSAGWGLVGHLAWNGAALVGEAFGWIRRDDPDTPYPCVLENTTFRLDRVEAEDDGG